MSLTVGWGLSETATCSIPRSLPCFVAVLAFLPLGLATFRCHAQERGEANQRRSVSADPRFRTPRETAVRWVDAVNGRHWGAEYECYAKDQQARFTLQVLMSTDEIRDSETLSKELQAVFDHHRFPKRLLDEYPSLRRDLSLIRGDAEIRRLIEQQFEERELQVERWKRHIHPMPIDWARLLDDLRPILVKNYENHLHGFHPSCTGVVHHLDYHRFVNVSIDEIDGASAYGTVVPILRDSKSMIDDDPFRGKFDGLTFLLDHQRWLSLLRKRRGERLPETIRLVRVDEGWKLDSVPFR